MCAVSEGGNQINTLLIKPRGERKVKPKWVNRHIEFESGKEQVQGVSTKANYLYELTFQGIVSEGELLEDFFNGQCGSRISFFWTDQRGVQQIVRFAEDSLDMQYKYGFDESGYIPVAYSVTVNLRLV